MEEAYEKWLTSEIYDRNPDSYACFVAGYLAGHASAQDYEYQTRKWE